MPVLEVRPSKIEFFDNRSTKYTCSQVREKTGADIVFNASLFKMDSTLAPLCDIRIKGVTLSDDEYGYWGYGWNANDFRPVMVNSNSMSNYYNFVTCVALCKDGATVGLNYNSDMGGTRGRTAFGFRSDGTMVIYCFADGTSGASTIEGMQTKMLETYKCKDAINLDGGGSCQLSSVSYGNVTSRRTVSNFICVWVKPPDVTAPVINFLAST
jgi:hypothetical protein